MNKLTKTMRYLNFNKDLKHFEIKTTEVPVPSPNDYLVKVYATCLNRVDILEKAGKYTAVKDNKILGIELVGVPVDFETLEPLGDKPKLIGGIIKGGSYAEYALINKEHTFEFDFGIENFGSTALKSSEVQNDRAKAIHSSEHSKGLTDIAALCVSIPEAFMTAFQLLDYYGGVREGSFVYIPAAAGGIGTAAIQLVKNLYKGRVIASCSGKEKEKLCYDLGADVVINYKGKTDEEMEEQVLSVTKGKGVDCILDCIGPSKATFHGKILAQDAHWVLYGFLGGAKAQSENLMSDILFKRIHLTGSLLRNRSDEYKRTLVEDVKAKVLPLFKSRALFPVVGHQLGLNLNLPEDAKVMDEAHGIMESNSSLGRIVVCFK